VKGDIVPPTPLALAITAGDAWTARLTIARANGDVPDLDGATAEAHIRPRVGSDSFIDVDVSLEADTGVVVLDLPPAQTERLRGWPAAVWDLQITLDGGRPGTWLAGPVHITRDVTR
jgi:hypothetical protein